MFFEFLDEAFIGDFFQVIGEPDHRQQNVPEPLGLFHIRNLAHFDIDLRSDSAAESVAEFLQ